MDGLFSGAEREWQKMEHRDPTGTAELLKWLTGNSGTAKGLRDGRLVAVPAGSVGSSQTEAQTLHAIQGAVLSMFCDCLSDDEALEYYGKEAPVWVPAMRQLAKEAGIADTTSIIRLIDPTRHMPFNMKISARHCGPCVDDFSYMRDWQYNGAMSEWKARKKLLVFGAPFVAPGSCRKTMKGQVSLLGNISRQISVPKLVHGSAALGALLSLSHLHETGGELVGQRLPAKNLLVRTNSLSGSNRLDLGWFGGRLSCDYWDWIDDDFRHDDLGCFALGVVELGH